MSTNMKLLCLLLLACFTACTTAKQVEADTQAQYHQAAKRIVVEVKINGQKARLAFDTGAEASILFSKSCKRLKIAYTPSNNDSSIIAGETDKCRFELFGLKKERRFEVIKI